MLNSSAYYYRKRQTAVKVLLLPHFCTYSLQNSSVVFVGEGARIFLASGRRVP